MLRKIFSYYIEQISQYSFFKNLSHHLYASMEPFGNKDGKGSIGHGTGKFI